MYVCRRLYAVRGWPSTVEAKPFLVEDGFKELALPLGENQIGWFGACAIVR
jgi:hypothetical protein